MVTRLAQVAASAIEKANEKLRRNPLGCYGAARYISRTKPIEYHMRCKVCELYDPCWDIGLDPAGYAVVLEENE